MAIAIAASFAIESLTLTAAAPAFYPKASPYKSTQRPSSTYNMTATGRSAGHCTATAPAISVHRAAVSSGIVVMLSFQRSLRLSRLSAVLLPSQQFLVPRRCIHYRCNHWRLAQPTASALRTAQPLLQFACSVVL